MVRLRLRSIEMNKETLAKIFSGIEESNSDDFYLGHRGTSNLSNIDYLLFFDSRGRKSNQPNSDRIIHLIENNLTKSNASYIALSRPVCNTTFFSLLIFLEKCHFKFKNLITNVGFVDLTPKKMEICSDLSSQIQILGMAPPVMIHMGSYLLSKNEVAELFSLDWICYVGEISKRLEMHQLDNIFLVETPVIDSKTEFERNRPAAFFSQLIETNSYINLIHNNLKKSKVIPSPLPVTGTSISEQIYDGVHYTERAHRIFSDWIMKNVLKSRS